MTTSPPDLSSLRIRRDDAPAGPPRGRVTGIVIAVIVLLGGVGAFWALKPRPIAVETAQATATGGGMMSAAGITANGYVVARTKASVSAKVPGQLEYLGVHEGSHVGRGEVIARTQSNQEQAALAAAKAEVAQADAQVLQAKRDLDRAEALAKQQVLSTADLDNARTRYNVAEAQLKSARAQVQLADVNLENTRVRAPFEGTVLRKDAEVGEIVAPASAGGGLTRTAIVTMADLRTLEVEVDVNEAYISQVGGAQPARITLDAYPDTSFSGMVRQVVPTADRQKATVLVKVSILDRDPRILPEMGAKVVFTRAEAPAGTAPPLRVLVPSAAVVDASGAAKVWIVEDGRAHRRAVEVGPERGGQIEVRRGLAGGETVVLKPPAQLQEGAQVKVARS
jgi:RND family efflux transporter MFP subunit